MTSFNVNDIFIKEEHDIASHPKVSQLLFRSVNSNNKIKQEPNEFQSLQPPLYEVTIKKEVTVKEEEIDEVTEFVKSTVVDQNESLQVDPQYKDPSSMCDEVQVKQETNDMGNVKPTTAVCNNVLDHVKLEQTDSVEAAGEHFIGECDYCNKMFDIRLSLVKHIHNHIIQESCKSLDNIGSTHVKGKSNKERPYICSICNKSYIQSSHLKTHELTHKNERPFVCSICNKRFMVIYQLRNHERTHSNERPYVCDVCNRRFLLICNLKTHERTHTNERPFACKVCNKKFMQSCHLRTHERTHTNERPFVCNVCNKKFTQRCHLRTHELTHTNERPHVCNVCNKSFSVRSSLRIHTFTHTNERPHLCNVCNKTFTNSSNLRTHELTHTNERPFVCNICNKRFTQSSNLRTHAITHTNERPYVCHVCNKRFSLSSNLKAHEQTRACQNKRIRARVGNCILLKELLKK